MKSSSTAPTITSAGTASSVSCEASDYWAPTVSKWAEEDVDARLKSWALSLIPDPPTTVVKGSFPTQLPQILTGFGDTNKYENVIGTAGQSMSIAKGGMDASSVLVDGPNGQCLPISVSDASSPRTLELKSENIGWNLISGGAPAKAIDYGQGSSATVPNTMPTPCYAGDPACGAADGGWYPRGLGNRGVSMRDNY
ncbi:hypothetical protein HO173_011347 [Letharia columbiana]|uniref:Uncharacterized protein n=1 Tax=Letharia columbiana TaxID=112416 RepID=A0A8H6FJJ8_9LECA|nr:uncharacterized protein HO173_011347 [Letharia columbiana]KAF6229701.1 hypothetical protein HO173_011347 [Letharia columbiana]